MFSLKRFISNRKICKQEQFIPQFPKAPAETKNSNKNISQEDEYIDDTIILSEEDYKRLIAECCTASPSEADIYESNFDYRKAYNKKIIYVGGTHVQGCEYTEITLCQFEGKYFYTVNTIYDKMNAGGYSKLVPEYLITDGNVDIEGLLSLLGKR